MYISSAFARKLEGLDSNTRDVMFSLVEEIRAKDFATKSDFDELKNVVKELIQAQTRTDEKLAQLTEKVNQLAEKVNQLAEKVNQLAEAQRRTEVEIGILAVKVNDIQKQIGGMSMVIGYGLEDKIMPYIYDFGKKEFGIEVRLIDRRNIVYPDGKYDEINIYAEGTKNGRPAFIIGECKAQPGKKDMDKFNQLVDRVKKVISGDIYPFMVGYQFSPQVEDYIQKKYFHLKCYKSFEFELKYNKGIAA